jgi:hypothetical protein
VGSGFELGEDHFAQFVAGGAGHGKDVSDFHRVFLLDKVRILWG